jgi:hypothetical protein
VVFVTIFVRKKNGQLQLQFSQEEKRYLTFPVDFLKAQTIVFQ